MKAVVFRDIGDIRLEEVPDPRIEAPGDAVVRLTASAICGTDLHFVRGTVPGLKPGVVLGHEGVGIVEEMGPAVRNLRVGDRVVIPSTVACGYCSYCRAGYFANCDVANPKGPQAGTAFFGGPEDAGGLNGLQAERARVPFAAVGLVKLPESVTDDQAIMLSDIFPTGYFATVLAEVKPGDTVAVFGCGPVGQFAIASARLLGAGRVFAVDAVPSRLEMARAQGAEAINFDVDDPIEMLRELTGGIGVDRAIDAVGVDAERPHRGPAAEQVRERASQYDEEIKRVAPQARPASGFHPGNAPSLALEWAVEAVAKAGSVSIVGVYPNTMQFFPLGKAMGKNVTIKTGSCHHRRYIPELLRLVQTGVVDPTEILTQVEPLTDAIEAYKAFDQRQPGWMKVELEPVLA
jgi:threonine dehydrogenase-like Zn-dependent dehydrogenase